MMRGTGPEFRLLLGVIVQARRDVTSPPTTEDGRPISERRTRKIVEDAESLLSWVRVALKEMQDERDMRGWAIDSAAG